MNKKLNVTGKVAALLVAVVFSAACSDGGFGTGPKLTVDPGIAPSITKFEISKVGGEDAASSSVLIAKGDSVTVAWEVIMPSESASAPATGGTVTKADVAPAFTLTLDCESLGIHMEGLAGSGSQTFPNLTADAEFVLTASAGGEPAVRRVTATIAAVNAELGATLTVDPSTIYSGESANLCWTVERFDATYTVQDDQGTILAASANVQPTNPELTEGGDLTISGKAAYKASDSADNGISNCVSVSPLRTTNYKLTASVEGSADVVKEALLTVNAAVTINSFTATPSEITGQTNVTLAWSVTPENAIVSISGVEGEFESTGSTQVTVYDTTTFTLTAKLPDCDEAGCTATADVRVGLAYSGSLKLELSGDRVIFAGDNTSITWKVTDQNGLSVNGAAVTIMGGEFGDAGSVQNGSGTLTVAPTETTDYIFVATAAGTAAIAPQKIRVAVRSWKGPGAAGSVSSVNVSKAQKDVIYVGYKGQMTDVKDAAGKTSKGVAIGRGVGEGPKWDTIGLPYMGTYPALNPNGGNNFAFFNMLEYPVNAVATTESGKMYVATTGGVFVSEDEGASWTTLVGILLGEKIALPHNSCKGGVIKGWADQKVHGLSQVCDVVVASDGRVIIATDTLIEYLPAGTVKVSDWKAVHGNVNHDLEIAVVGGREMVFAGSSAGVRVSLDLGGTFNGLSGEGSPAGDIYTVYADSENGLLYAGSSDGIVYQCVISESGCSKWTNYSVGTAVYSLAGDPVKSGALFAGTAEGIFYSDGGSEWRNVTSGGMRADAPVFSVAGVRNGKFGTVYVGTEDGVFTSTSEVVRGVPRLCIDATALGCLVEPPVRTPETPTVPTLPLTTPAAPAVNGMLF